MKEKIYKPKDFAKLVNRKVWTLQRWDREGKLVAHRTSTNRRYYTHSQYLEVMGLKNNTDEGRTVVYTRVSNRNQKDDLENQIKFLREFANARGYIIDNFLSDIGSGLNYNRKEFNNILYATDIKRLIISHKDRFVRFGYDWFVKFLENKGVEVILVNNETTSPESEVVQDLISIIHVFSCRIYGLRKYKSKIKDIVNEKNNNN